MADENATGGNGNGNGKIIARFAAKWKAASERLKGVEAENSRLKAQLGEVTTERDTFRSRADESKLAKANAELTQKLRGIVHKGRFAALAAEQGVDPDLVDDLYQLSGYAPEADEPDDAVLGERLAALKEAKPKYFAARPEAPAEPPAKVPAPAAGRGERQGGSAVPKVTRALLNDPVWCMKNQELVINACKAGTVVD